MNEREVYFSLLSLQYKVATVFGNREWDDVRLRVERKTYVRKIIHVQNLISSSVGQMKSCPT
jgi:hypothetical protein